MARFDLDSVLAGRPPIFEHVPESGTMSQIEYIDLSLIDSDPNNFYELSGIDELASNIALCGLQQPILVRSGDNGRVVIVSGHRRRAALQKLVDEGGEKWKKAPCIRQKAAESPELQELHLIMGNSDTRQLTPGDQRRQTERLEFLFEELKKQGYQIQGRIRDHVANITGLSKTKIGNQKVISERLISNLKPAWENGTLAESSALRIAQEIDSVQMKLLAKHGTDLYKWTEDQITKAIDRVKRPEPEQRHDEVPARQAAEKYLQELEAENVRFLDAMRNLGYDLLSRYLEGKSSRRDGIEAFKKGPGFSHRGGSGLSWDYQCMPQYFSICIHPDQEIKRSWTEVYDAMAVVALERERAAQTQQNTAPAAPVQQPQDEWAVWSCGEDELPNESGFYWCITGPMDSGGRLLWWNEDEKVWEHPGVKYRLTSKVLAWIKCPEIPESISWNREVGW